MRFALSLPWSYDHRGRNSFSVNGLGCGGGTLPHAECPQRIRDILQNRFTIELESTS